MKTLLLILAALVLACIGAIYLFGNPVTNDPGIFTPSNELIIEQKDGYVMYYPDTFSDSTMKRLILILDPGSGWKSYMQNWKSTADDYGYALASIPNWDDAKVISFLHSAKSKEAVDRVYMTGFSGGGYGSCYIGLEQQQYIDGLLPMGSYCNNFDVDESQMTVPVLTVIGELDDWALGEEGNLPYDFGVESEIIIVPSIGHNFPTAVMDDVGKWIEAH